MGRLKYQYQGKWIYTPFVWSVFQKHLTLLLRYPHLPYTPHVKPYCNQHTRKVFHLPSYLLQIYYMGSISNPYPSMYFCICYNIGRQITCTCISPWVRACTWPLLRFNNQNIPPITSWNHTLCLQTCPLTPATFILPLCISSC